MRIGSVERTLGDVVMEWRGQALTSCEDSYYLTHSTFSRYDVFTEKCRAGQEVTDTLPKDGDPAE